MLPSLLFAGVCGATLSLGAEAWASSPGSLQPSRMPTLLLPCPDLHDNQTAPS